MDVTATTRSRAAIAVAALLALLGFATVVAMSVRDADAKSAKIIGKTKKTPDPGCPKRCNVAGSVTGIQTVADGSRGVSKVPSNGHIVAWSVHLGKPSKDDRTTFDSFFPDNKFKGKASARISILKPKGKGKYKLVKQSPAVALSGRLGSDPIFTLKKPLKVKKGLRVGITTVTWGPYFSSGLPSNDNKWRASRNQGTCNQDAKEAKPQQKKGTTRQYRCQFKGERLLYWSWLVPSGGGKKN
ncbi:MAG: hypothetical protein R2718_10275 [Solirubrobacterales bacterium]|nr:hypothetical protein [Solirubrobacterales bacterium]